MSFDDDGFGITSIDASRMCWDDVERIVAYKTDCITVDEICVRFDWAHGALVVTEEAEGFREFMQQVVLRFPTASNWFPLVSQPPFAR